MPIWKHTLKLKDILGEDVSNQAVGFAAKTMHERLEKARLSAPLNRPEFDPAELEAISDEFHTIAFVDAPAGNATDTYFNQVLAALYDWADEHRVWID